jgi:LytS/YehU family sensor histidine kinase
LQPLVENAVLHGLEPSAEGGEIHVSASLSGSDLILTVADTGLGIAPIANHASETGFGLLQIRERLAMLHDERAALAIAPNPPRGTRVTLTLPQPTAHEANHCAYC